MFVCVILSLEPLCTSCVQFQLPLRFDRYVIGWWSFTWQTNNDVSPAFWSILVWSICSQMVKLIVLDFGLLWLCNDAFNYRLQTFMSHLRNDHLNIYDGWTVPKPFVYRICARRTYIHKHIRLHALSLCLREHVCWCVVIVCVTCRAINK